MNADYLAKMIFHYWNETEGVEIPQTLLEDAATMLREQQRTIDGDKRLINLLYKKIEKLQSDNAELKAYNTELHGIEHDLEMKVMQQQAEIEKLKKQEFAIGQEAISPAPTLEEIIKWQEEQIKNLEPKALTDEEIMEVAYNLKNSYEPYNINFARAILRKAQEK